MRRITRITAAAGLAAAMATALTLATAGEAKAQGAIGFQPIVTPFSDGVFLDTTPVVSADRRYVRLGVNPSFNALRAVQPFPFAAGAVSGGGFTVGGLGGVGGFGGFGNFGGAAVVPGLGAVGPVGGFYGTYGWPGVYAGYPYGFPGGVVAGYPAGPLATGPYIPNPSLVPQAVNTLGPMGYSIMNSIAPGSWDLPLR